MGDSASLDLLERAQVISEATGRTVPDVLADLADDGILNDSHKQGGDLISQLKEAAELINTVQAVNQRVSENTVLNGGNNATEVKVDTTLEGDIVDRAIASAQRKADAIKKLALVIAPVFLLLGGNGVYDMMNDEPVDDHDVYYDEYGGCLAADAQNYDPYASWDDGTCYWDDTGQSCWPSLSQDEAWAQTIDGDNHSLSVHMKIYNHDSQCEVEVEVMVSIYLNNSYQWTWEFGEVGTFWMDSGLNEIGLYSSDLSNLGEGDWSFETRYRAIGHEEDCCLMTEPVTIV